MHAIRISTWWQSLIKLPRGASKNLKTESQRPHYATCVNYEIYAPGHNHSKGHLAGYNSDLIRDLCSGKVLPFLPHDFTLLNWIGGPKPLPWPSKWTRCLLCATEWHATAFPGKTNSWQWPSICQSCADRW